MQEIQEIDELVKDLERSIPILSSFVAAIPEEALEKRRCEGCWTVAEHVRHLAGVQPMLMERLRRFREEEHPVFSPYIPAEEESHVPEPPQIDLDVALEKFDVWRRKQIELAGELTEEDWRKTADHPEYRRYTPAILLRHILMHDFWHMYRMEELWLTRDAFLTRLPG